MAIWWHFAILRACVTHNLKFFFFGGLWVEGNIYIYRLKYTLFKAAGFNFAEMCQQRLHLLHGRVTPLRDPENVWHACCGTLLFKRRDELLWWNFAVGWMGLGCRMYGLRLLINMVLNNDTTEKYTLVKRLLWHYNFFYTRCKKLRISCSRE
jgi:hypothetical protein